MPLTEFAPLSEKLFLSTLQSTLLAILNFDHLLTINKDAIGAKVQVFIGNKILMREVSAGSSYLSSNSKVLHFGLAHQTIDSIKVYWSKDHQQLFENVPVNQFYRLSEGEGLEEITNKLTTSILPDPPFENKHITLSPNPSNGNILIHSSLFKKTDYLIQINDANGNVVYRQDFKQSLQEVPIQINAGQFKPGLYIVKAMSGKMSLACKLVILGN